MPTQEDYDGMMQDGRLLLNLAETLTNEIKEVGERMVSFAKAQGATGDTETDELPKNSKSSNGDMNDEDKRLAIVLAKKS